MPALKSAASPFPIKIAQFWLHFIILNRQFPDDLCIAKFWSADLKTGLRKQHKYR
jgi:hypothetical protein